MSPTQFIPLTKGHNALVDESDYDTLMRVGRWCYSKSGYAVHYFADDQGRSRTLYMHREILAYALSKAPPGMQIDHINHQPLDCRRCNLRLATRSQNQAHKRRRQDSTSPFKGVTRNTGKWEARIKYGSQRFNLGRFDKPEDAAWMYDAASRLLNAAFAGPNFAEHPRRMLYEQVIVVLTGYGLDTTNLYRSDAFYRSR